jgi:ABC-type transport system involved in cytochrome c biogenesis permease component
MVLQAVFYLIGYGLAIGGAGLTCLGGYSVLSYLLGQSCSTGLLGLLVLPVSVPMATGGVVCVREARRYRPESPPGRQ